MSLTPTADWEERRSKRWAVLWSVQRSQRYHARRRTFYERWNKGTALVSILGGSAVFAGLTKYFDDRLIAAGASAALIMSAVDLVASTVQQARLHDDLRRRFCALEQEIQREEEPDLTTIARWRAQRLEIEADEPPTYVALNLLCENELGAAYGKDINFVPNRVGRFKRWTAQFWHWHDS